MNRMPDPSPKPAFQGLTLETAISVTKSILLAIGFISTVILFKVAIIPKSASLFITTLPRLWDSFRLWLSPPYVFIIFHFLIVAAVASSAFRRHKDTSETNYTSISHENTHVSATPPYKSTHEDRDYLISARSGEIWNGISDEDEQGKEEEEEEEEEERKPTKWDFPTLFAEKFSDPSSEKFCAYSSEKVEEEKDDGGGGGDDSMDATWKAIMERQGKQTPQLKKSQTWDSPPPARLIRAGGGEEEPVAWDRNEIRKSEKFQQTMSFRRKISMTSEELKSRAEAFIEMVNRSIRLQRQESEQRFLQAMKRSF